MNRYEEDETDLRDDELSHIVEIYDFPTEFKTEDLLKLFQNYQYVTFIQRQPLSEKHLDNVE